MKRIINACFSTKARIDKGGPSLGDFLKQASDSHAHTHDPAKRVFTPLEEIPSGGAGMTYFIETYGCQMNVSDSEIVRSVLHENGHTAASSPETADLVLVNTCAIRENAEAKIWSRLAYFQSLRRDNRMKPRNQQSQWLDSADDTAASSQATSAPASASAGVFDNLPKKKERAPVAGKSKGHKAVTKPFVGVLGCMAERLKEKLLDEDSVDFVVGPDSYRDIPRLIGSVTSTGQKEANTQLSLEETYADIAPVREADTCSAFVSIMRGCNNMCSYCIVPFTRGRERSRHMNTIMNEIDQLVQQGVKEVCLLGQNVNGFHDVSEASASQYPASTYQVADGFSNIFRSRSRHAPGARFADLLAAVSGASPELRIRFTSPHPKDFPLEVLQEIADRPNLCKSLHMPAQSGSTSVLQRMRRGYSREAYLELVARAREIIPGVTISTDMITGFCGETEAEHQDTLSLMEEVAYDQAFLFAYSLRDKTHASHKMEDDVPLAVKNRRLQEVIDVYRRKLREKNSEVETGKSRLVLVEGSATRSTPDNPMWTGRTDGNKRVVFSAANAVLPSLQSPHLQSMLDLLQAAHPRLRQAVQVEVERESRGPSLGLTGSATTEVARTQGRLMRAMADTLHGALQTLPAAHVVSPQDTRKHLQPGDYVVVHIAEAEGPTLRGVALSKSSMAEFHAHALSRLG